MKKKKVVTVQILTPPSLVTLLNVLTNYIVERNDRERVMFKRTERSFVSRCCASLGLPSS